MFKAIITRPCSLLSRVLQTEAELSVTNHSLCYFIWSSNSSSISPLRLYETHALTSLITAPNHDLNDLTRMNHPFPLGITNIVCHPTQTQIRVLAHPNAKWPKAPPAASPRSLNLKSRLVHSPILPNQITHAPETSLKLVLQLKANTTLFTMKALFPLQISVQVRMD